MRQDPLSRAFRAILPRPAQTTEWADLNEVLGERCDDILTALGAEWETEGPLFEGGALCIEAWRNVQSSTGKAITLTFYVGFTVTAEDAPPARMAVTVYAHEEPSGEQVISARRHYADLRAAALMAVGAAAGFLVWRANDQSVALAIITAIATVVGLLVAMIAIGAALPRRTDMTSPSPEFLALAAALEEYLRGPGSPFVDVEADDTCR